MGYEIKYSYHTRKEGGGYDTESKHEKVAKVGKPFDDTPLDSVAAAIMAQLARRDVWVVDVEVTELVRQQISFKECGDGKGILLKNKRYSFNEAAQMVAEELGPPVHPHEMLQPHEMIHSTGLATVQEGSDLVSPQAQPARNRAPVNPKRVLYRVVFDPSAKDLAAGVSKKNKLTVGKNYPVHQVDDSMGIQNQRLTITDDTGKLVTLPEAYFTVAGAGLLLEGEFRTNPDVPSGPAPKLSYDEPQYVNRAVSGAGALMQDNVMAVVDIRAKK